MKKKCFSCGKTKRREYNYCPYCGVSFKQQQEKQNYGLLGREDNNKKIVNELQLPLGLNKLVESLTKQLEKQMNNINIENQQGQPKGFKIKISTGKEEEEYYEDEEEQNIPQHNITKKEQQRRIQLPKKETTTKVKRLADKIIYELETPGVTNNKDIEISELATGYEIRAYTKKECYKKYIPIKSNITNYYITKGKTIIELKE
jgi:hypothetical protein